MLRKQTEYFFIIFLLIKNNISLLHNVYIQRNGFFIKYLKFSIIFLPKSDKRPMRGKDGARPMEGRAKGSPIPGICNALEHPMQFAWKVSKIYLQNKNGEKIIRTWVEASSAHSKRATTTVLDCILTVSMWQWKS